MGSKRREIAHNCCMPVWALQGFPTKSSNKFTIATLTFANQFKITHSFTLQIHIHSDRQPHKIVAVMCAVLFSYPSY